MRQEHHRQAASRREGGSRRASEESPSAAGPVAAFHDAPKAQAVEDPEANEGPEGEGEEEEIVLAPKVAAGKAALLGRPLPASASASPAPASPAPPRPASAAATPAPACPPGFKARPLSATSSPQPPLAPSGPGAEAPGGGAALLEALMQGPAPAKGAPGGASTVAPQTGTAQEAAGGRKVSRALALEDSSSKEKEQGKEGPSTQASVGQPAEGGAGRPQGLGGLGLEGHQAMTLDEVEAAVSGLAAEKEGEVAEGAKDTGKEAAQGTTDSLRNFTSLASWLPSLTPPSSAAAPATEEPAGKGLPAKGGALLVPSTPSFSSWSSATPPAVAEPTAAAAPAPLGESDPAAALPGTGESGPGSAPAASSSLFGSSLFFPGSIFSWSPAPAASATAAAAWGAVPASQGSAAAKGAHAPAQGTDPAAESHSGQGPGAAAGAGTGSVAAALPSGPLEHSDQRAKGERAPQGVPPTAAGKGLTASGENGGSTGSLLEILERYKGDHGAAAHDQPTDAAQGPRDAQALSEVRPPPLWRNFEQSSPGCSCYLLVAVLWPLFVGSESGLVTSVVGE